MTSLNCIIIEDNKAIQHLLSSYIQETKNLNLLDIFENPVEVLQSPLNSEVDVIFLDIEMPKMSGIEFLQQSDINAHVIITTSNKDYAIHGYENNAIDFLLKPISYSRFLKAINKVWVANSNVKKANKYLFIKSNKDYVKIEISDILWIQSASEYVLIYTSQGKHMVYSNMKDILSKLNSNFMQVHRSYIIALDKVEKISKNHVTINGNVISVSKTYSKKLMSTLGIA